MPGEDNRYAVDPLDGPAAMAETLRRLEQRVSALEGAPLAGVSAAVYDADGEPLVALGDLGDGDRGILVHSATDDWDLVRMTTEGWIRPHLSGISLDPAAFISVTSASFVQTWVSTYGEALGPGVEGYFTWATPAGTAGEVRLTDNNVGATTAHALAAASSGSIYCRWLHTLQVGTGPMVVDLEVRRTAGAGAVTVSPLRSWVQDPGLCSSGGVFL